MRRAIVNRHGDLAGGPASRCAALGPVSPVCRFFGLCSGARSAARTGGSTAHIDQLEIEQLAIDHLAAEAEVTPPETRHFRCGPHVAHAKRDAAPRGLGASKSKRPTEERLALNTGGLGRNRTTDTRIFNLPKNLEKSTRLARPVSTKCRRTPEISPSKRI